MAQSVLIRSCDLSRMTKCKTQVSETKLNTPSQNLVWSIYEKFLQLLHVFNCILLLLLKNQMLTGKGKKKRSEKENEMNDRDA